METWPKNTSSDVQRGASRGGSLALSGMILPAIDGLPQEQLQHRISVLDAALKEAKALLEKNIAPPVDTAVPPPLQIDAAAPPLFRTDTAAPSPLEPDAAAALPVQNDTAFPAGERRSFNWREDDYMRLGDSSIFLRPVLPFKAGSTEWMRLLLRQQTDKLIPPQNNGGGLSYIPHVIYYRHEEVERLAAARPTELTAQTICLVRNPFSRLVSFYIDKVLRHPSHALITPGVKLHNATFDQFVHCAMKYAASKHHPMSRLTLEHYAPISLEYPRCAKPGTRILKVEDLDQWYADTVHEFHLEPFVRSGWRRSGGGEPCFHVPRGLNCSTALARTVASRFDASSVRQRRHTTDADRMLCNYFKQKLEAEVRAWMDRDLELFGYNAPNCTAGQALGVGKNGSPSADGSPNHTAFASLTPGISLAPGTANRTVESKSFAAKRELRREGKRCSSLDRRPRHECQAATYAGIPCVHNASYGGKCRVVSAAHGAVG